MTNELTEKLNKAIAYLKANEPPEGYIVAFSGGRDSCVVKDILTRNDIKAKYYYAETTLENNMFLEFMREYHSDVEWVHAKKSVCDFIKEYAKAPCVSQRFCCRKVLYPNLWKIQRLGTHLVTGNRYMTAVNRTFAFVKTLDSSTIAIRPIFDWSVGEVQQYVEEYSVPINPTYELYGKGVNCVCCPAHYASTKEITKEYHPEVFEKLKEAVMYAWENNETLHQDYPTAEAYWEWYSTADGHDEYVKARELNLLPPFKEGER